MRRFAGRLRLSMNLLVEAEAVDVFEREIGEAVQLADVVDLDDVRVLEPGDGFSLGMEAGQLRRPGMGAG